MSGQTMGSGTGERVSKSGTGWEASGQIVGREVGREQFICGGTGNAGTEISNGRGRETSVGF